ncbi:T7SS effector LXG polymorphic toxin [Priestia megaterium]|uniref:T7SS effector LXG polymorphic toxin n=1 Tax=Priestia megaterium TaxID=1404 RepID=UPI00203D885D|nr:T7SS effector LXG polymorphic toxin [Priestia megaterium]MCM3793701.1 T7SS effector LXG polymorphic toxin [Priestia megaterium]
MGKVYDAKALFDVAKDREKAYDELLSQLGELKKALQGVADLEGSLEGKGADNIKSFYKQHVDTAGQWENLIKMQQSYFSTLHVKAEKAKLSGSTIVTESFLETELKNANSNAKEMVAQQHDDLQSILNGIDDIVSISAFSTSEFNDKIEEAEKKRTDTIEAVNQLDAEWSKEYSEMDDFYAVVDTLVSGLELATSQGGSVYQLAFDEKAYHDSELYKVQTKLNDYATSYVDYNKQQEEVYELEKKQEEEANKPWYEKTWDAVSTFTGEVSGYYDYKRAAEGVDPVTGEKLSTSQRVAAGAMAAAGFIPVVGWVGRAAKGGKAIYKTAKGLSAADHALDAYKSAKSFKVLEQTEKGLYGLVAANGLGEYMTGRDMFGNKISEEQRKASLLQALGIAGAGALSTKVAGKMGQSLATKGTEKLNNMRNTLRTSAVANVTKQAYQSVKNAPASWTQSLHKTYNNILDSSMPRLMPDLVPVGPALAQQTVRETLQNVKQQTMQMVTKVKYDPNHNSYRGPDGRFMSESDVTKMGDEVEVETLRKVDEPVKVEPEIQKVTDEVVKNGDVSKKPYSSSRPSYGKGQVEQVWENAKDPINGKIYDPSGVEIGWDKSKPRNGQWDMGHIPGEKYSDIHELYMNGTITKKEFLEWYRDPANYRPELPSTNRGHEYE